MTKPSTVNVSWAVVIAASVALLATGAGATYVVLRADSARRDDDGHGTAAIGARPTPPADTVRATAGTSEVDVTVTLTAEAAERAGIIVSPVRMGGTMAGVRLPGIVEANTYKQVAVTPVTGGRVTRVLVELGQHVGRGQLMAEVFSPDLAEAQTRYISARAELDAHEQELTRTQALADIGAASRQELERIHARHTAQTAQVESARVRLELLGVSPGTTGARIAVPAPIDGVVTERLANVGLNVDPASALFTVADLSTVWVVADVYEKDVPLVRVGTAATVTMAAYPGRILRGRVSYIDPHLDANSRTAKARIEVPNPQDDLRLGMYADVAMAADDAARVALIPRSAVQSVGDRQVVYVADARVPGAFTERGVQLGSSAGSDVVVTAGLTAGDSIVTEGSFSVRAERDRVGVRAQPGPGTSAPVAHAASEAALQKADVQTARVTVNERAFEPSRLTLRAGVPARITFVRTSDKTCATEVAFPSLKIKRPLPLNEPVVIELTPAKGELVFLCGMNMLKGSIVAE